MSIICSFLISSIHPLHAFNPHPTALTDVPHPPAKPQISDIDATKMTVTWSPPEFNGGSEITGYVLERQEVGRDRWVKVHMGPLPDTTFTCTDLIEGKEYVFRVSAENEAGLSKPSEPSDTSIAKPPYGETSCQCYSSNMSFSR